MEVFINLLNVLSKLADNSSEKDDGMAGSNSKTSYPPYSDFAFYSSPTLVRTFQGVESES